MGKLVLLRSIISVLACMMATPLWALDVTNTNTADPESEATDIMELETLTVVGQREARISSGATKLPLEIKETPQSISVLDSETMSAFGAYASNEALKFSTGLNVDQYETNRARFNSRGFNIQLTQVDGLGMTNDWGTVQGQMDTFLFEKIEFIRGANGLLTGVGNASGTINYVRKRPTNEDSTKLVLNLGDYQNLRAAVDTNQVLTDDGLWAARVIAIHEDKDSYLRDLHNTNTTLHAVVDGQIGGQGVLTASVTLQDSQQDSTMWGSLTLFRVDGSQADFPVSSSTAQDWTYWNIQTTTALLEYTHFLNHNWEAKATYNYRQAQGESRLFYAATVAGLQANNTGYFGSPYSDETTRSNQLFDIHIQGEFGDNNLIAGASYSVQDIKRSEFDFDTTDYISFRDGWITPLPSFPYPGDAIDEPIWGDLTLAGTGEQALSRLYVANRTLLTDRWNLILGANSIILERKGTGSYSDGTDNFKYPNTEETSFYTGVTYDITDAILGYASYSDIFQNQDQTDINGAYLDPTQGVNIEAGLKAQWFDEALLTTLAIFSAEQQGLATNAGLSPITGLSYFEPRDVNSQGVELEVVGQINSHTNLAVGITKLSLKGPDGNDIYLWIPRDTIKARLDTQLSALPQLKLGVAARHQSKTSGKNARQGSYAVTDVFAAYKLNSQAKVQLNINNIFNEKYVTGLGSGALYGAPIMGMVSLDYDF